MFGKHAAYIIPSYVATVVVILALIVWIIVVYKKRRKEIADLEAKGIVRASAKKTSSGDQS